MESEKANTSPAAFYLLMFVVAFALNWCWEILQTFAFDLRGVGTAKMLLFCTLASIIDAIVTLVVFFVLNRFLNSRDWKFFVSASIFGALLAISFEQIAFTFSLWSYDDSMPVLPIIGTGLFPLMQLPVLVPIAIWMTGKVRKI